MLYHYHITGLCAEEGVRQARLCTEILYQNRLEKLATLSETDARVLFKNAPLLTLTRDPGAVPVPPLFDIPNYNGSEASGQSRLLKVQEPVKLHKIFILRPIRVRLRYSLKSLIPPAKIYSIL